MRAGNRTLTTVGRLPASAVAAGVLFAIGVWVRPTNLLLALPLAIAVRWRPVSLGAMVSGAAPIGAALAWWQGALYGSPFRTGYGGVGDVFTKTPDCAATQLSSLWTMLTPAVFCGAMFVFFAKGVSRSLRAAGVGARSSALFRAVH